MPHNEPECSQKVWYAIFKVKVIDQNMTVSTISAELETLLLPNLVCWYIIISQNILQRNGIVVLKVKVTTNFKMLMKVCVEDIF